MSRGGGYSEAESTEAEFLPADGRPGPRHGAMHAGGGVCLTGGCGAADGVPDTWT